MQTPTNTIPGADVATPSPRCVRSLAIEEARRRLIDEPNPQDNGWVHKDALIAVPCGDLFDAARRRHDPIELATTPGRPRPPVPARPPHSRLTTPRCGILSAAP